jgi:hypothetical protein
VRLSPEEAVAIYREDLDIVAELATKYDVDPAENFEISAVTGWIYYKDE